MSKVYVVTEGEYSDYHIVGAFSTKELAETFVAKYDDKLDNASVEEYDLDVFVPVMNDSLQSFFVRMHSSTGDVMEVHSRLMEPPKEDGYPSHDINGNMCFSMWARNAEHAVKIASERRARVLAIGGWK